MERTKYLLFLFGIMFISFIHLGLSVEGTVPVLGIKNLILILIGWVVFPLVIVVIHYIFSKEIRNGLWISLMEQYEILEDYKRFVGIKDCVKNYKYTIDNQETEDVLTNVNVVEAIIEREKTYSVLVPILITTVTALFIENEIFANNIILILLFSLLILVLLKELISQLPKYAFIKKVVASIREEIKVGNLNEEKDED